MNHYLPSFFFFPWIEYHDDDEVVPKNTKVIVSKIPARNPRASLRMRIEKRGHGHRFGAAET